MVLVERFQVEIEDFDGHTALPGADLRTSWPGAPSLPLGHEPDDAGLLFIFLAHAPKGPHLCRMEKIYRPLLPSQQDFLTV